ELGYNWRMSEISAALGLRQLHRLHEFISVRRRIATTYDKGIHAITGVTVTPIERESHPNYYKYVAIMAPGILRNQMKSRLKEEFDVSLSGEVYETPCHRQP